MLLWVEKKRIQLGLAASQLNPLSVLRAVGGSGTVTGVAGIRSFVNGFGSFNLDWIWIP